MKNVCALCLYKTKDEPKLKFEFLSAMDGNNSLKLVDSTYHAGTVQTDSRRTESPRWIKPEDVDLFKDKVGKVKSFLSKPHTTFNDPSSSEQPRHPSRSASPHGASGRSCHWRDCLAQCYGTWWPSQVVLGSPVSRLQKNRDRTGPRHQENAFWSWLNLGKHNNAKARSSNPGHVMMLW